MHRPLTEQYAWLWESSDSMPDVFEFLSANAVLETSGKVAVVLLDQQRRWQTECPLRVEDYLEKLPDLNSDARNKLELVLGEFQARRKNGTSITVDEFLTRFADIRDVLQERLSEFDALVSTVDMSVGSGQSGKMNSKPALQSGPPEHARSIAEPDTSIRERRLGRYPLIRLLGEGAFGRVWLGQDTVLQRFVAIKVPKTEQFQQPEDAEAYLAEARLVASLDHPHIVPVHDVGRTDDGSVYVVSKFIEGRTLRERIKNDLPTHKELAKLTATIAEALHYAHLKRLIHRDVKPANILFEDATGIPYLADFGLAIREEDYLQDGRIAGTPAYMSPEQARGEGHRLDGRSDIFSLGVVLYEMLTGQRPFRGTTTEILRQVTTVEPTWPREAESHIPPELERICRKALSKRAIDRYATAADFAADLERWDHESRDDIRELQVVPKGLRSFDGDDAHFFLELLPGPRNRDGLPDSIQFWKTRIEETDPEQCFAVGLIYGPCGCGKTSLVRAGLLPRLRRDIAAIYVEAAPDDTETRILNRLRTQLPGLPDNLELIETLTWLRRHEGRKTLIVIDQFEQWLHTHRIDQETELVRGLRQCDGSELQAIIMVRDDFAMAAARFMDALDIPIVQGRNFATVDLFDLDHAESVIIRLGQAFGKLPAQLSDLSDNERRFVSSVAAGLAKNGQVISVQLTLFVEMVKSKPWIPATLNAVGGTEGIGVNFLEEAFDSRSADPRCRVHQAAARKVLNALLPAAGTDIKGHMRSREELLHVSGYSDRPNDFQDLIRILDGEFRLITRTEMESQEKVIPPTVIQGTEYYQLTHDYLVASLRDWLTRKQKETRRGRAELLLADRADVWNARPENRQLLSLGQWLQIRWWTTRETWTPVERKMMRATERYLATRGTVLGLLLLVVAFSGWTIWKRVDQQTQLTHAADLVQAILDVETVQVPTIIDRMSQYRHWIDPLLRHENEKALIDSRQKLNTSLALLPDNLQVTYLSNRLLDAAPHDVPVIRDALFDYQRQLLEKLWDAVETPDDRRQHQRLRAAAALAKYDPDSERWEKIRTAVADDLVTSPVIHLESWMSSLRPVRSKLITPLSEVYRSGNRNELERSIATDILADYATDQSEVLADLLMDADESQFVTIFPKLAECRDQGQRLLSREIDRALPSNVDDAAKERVARRQANAAVALLRMGLPTTVWSLLKHSADPRVRTFLIHRLGPLRADFQAIVQRMDQETDVTIRRALILSLGEFSVQILTQNDRLALLPQLQKIYTTSSDPGLHAASEWLLRTWEQEAWLQQMNRQWATDNGRRMEGIQQSIRNDGQNASVQWYVNGQEQTLVVIPGPVQFEMGSPEKERGRLDFERQHNKRIGRSFAISASPITREQFARYSPTFTHGEFKKYPSPSCPIGGLTWYEAAAYCNWLNKQEGIPEDQWCYDRVGERMNLRKNYLTLTGYRLPTEAEMEYVNRAGAVTARFYGETDELLAKYAWYDKNSPETTMPAGRLKPNDLGFFDVLGNVKTWCQEKYELYPQATGNHGFEDQEGELRTLTPVHRVVRGASYVDLSSSVRSARRLMTLPLHRISDIGFRVARTFPAVDATDSNKPLFDFTALADHPDKLADLLMDGDKQQFAAVFPEFEKRADAVAPILINEIDRKRPGSAKSNDKQKLAKRQANAAVALIRTHRSENVWALLKHGPDPTLRSYLIHQLGPYGVDARTIIDRLDVEADISIRRALILSLGEFNEAALAPVRSTALLSKLQEIYRHDPDAGLHAASEWLLRTWKQQDWLKRTDEECRADESARRRKFDAVCQLLSSSNEKAPPQWYVTGQGQTMIALRGPVEFMMGSQKSEAERFPPNESYERKRINHSFAMDSDELTLEQFLRFKRDHQNLTTEDCPVNRVSWDDAVSYCNWLSDQEGIPQEQWYYQPNTDGENGDTLTIAPGDTTRTGYRLPTEIEWEYACRAGTVTKYSFGDYVDLVDRYGWYSESAFGTGHVPGSLKPNDFGLFDMHGNSLEWCQELYLFPIPPKTLNVPIDRSRRVARGGALFMDASSLRCAARFGFKATEPSNYQGFRVARTMPSATVPAAQSVSDGKSQQSENRRSRAK